MDVIGKGPRSDRPEINGEDDENNDSSKRAHVRHIALDTSRTKLLLDCVMFYKEIIQSARGESIRRHDRIRNS